MRDEALSCFEWLTECLDCDIESVLILTTSSGRCVHYVQLQQSEIYLRERPEPWCGLASRSSCLWLQTGRRISISAVRTGLTASVPSATAWTGVVLTRAAESFARTGSWRSLFEIVDWSFYQYLTRVIPCRQQQIQCRCTILYQTYENCRVLCADGQLELHAIGCDLSDAAQLKALMRTVVVRIANF